MSNQEEEDVDHDFFGLDFDPTEVLECTEDQELGLTPRLIDDQVHYTTRQKRERNRHRLPRVLKSDIKRHYSRMFMNTVNSADALEMQNFWNTFMTKSCKFVAQSDLSPACGFPSEMTTEGPRLTSHYLLGVFFMFPDMVVRMTDTRIITSAGWTGSRIEMDVEMTGTKVCSLPMHLWVPAVQTRSEGYSCDPAAPVVDSRSFSEPHAPGTGPIEQRSTASSSASVSKDSPSEHPPQRASAVRDTLIQQTPSSSSAESTAPAFYTSPYIPRAHIQAMYEHATPVASPLTIACKGKITFYLDTSNHIQHLHMFLQQINL